MILIPQNLQPTPTLTPYPLLVLDIKNTQPLHLLHLNSQQEQEYYERDYQR